jgi:hypothetical protein
MRDVYQAGSLHEAQMLVDRLAEVGIRTFVRNEHLQGALGELPVSLHPVVCVVDDQQWSMAREVVIAFERARRADPGPDRVCDACGETSPGNFQVCWKCREAFANG